ncbi:MAG TPA: archease [Candidatus Acidoferrum sp.]|nr:archease [Candidatus Acidoferrum sp.]
MTAAGYEYFDVEADVGVRAWGRDRAEAFAEAALAVLALGVAPAGVEERETRDVRAQAATVEDLLVAWINECVYVHEIEGFAVHRVSVHRVDDAVVHGVLHGESLEPSRHQLGTVVKGVTHHRVSVTETESGCEVSIIVDV